MPREVAKLAELATTNKAWNGDRESAEFRSGEIERNLLKKIFIKGGLVVISGKAGRVKEFTVMAHEGKESLRAADIDTEIHDFIVTLL